METLIEAIKLHEGYRDKVYTDSLGNLTCGWGHFLREGSHVPVEAAEAFFKYDIASALTDFRTLSEDHKCLLYLDINRKRVIVEMIYNLGLGGVRKFKNMLTAIKHEDYFGAADSMLDSKWAKQVGERAKVLAHIMRYGV